MYSEPADGVDIVHDFKVVPYPLAAEACLSVLVSGVATRIPPWDFIAVVDEWWRILVPDGRLMLAAPYGLSDLYLQDPTNCRPITEQTFTFFDPTHPSGFYQRYKPKPWRIKQNAWNAGGTIEIVLEKFGELDKVRALQPGAKK